MAIHIAPLDDDAKRQLLKAVADRGYANGLDAAAELLSRMADDHMRVVGTNSIRELAEVLRDKAVHMRHNADGAIRTLEALNQ